MKSKFFAFGALALIAAPVFAQVPVASVPGRVMNNTIKADKGNDSGGTAATLWDQSDYDVSQNAFVDQDFVGDFPSYSSFLVNDIDTLGAVWNVSTVSEWFTFGFGAWNNGITTADVQVYPKTGALPDNSNVPPGGTAPMTLTNTTNVDGWIVATNTSGVAGLQGISGKYWVGCTPQATFGTYLQEFHYETISNAKLDHTAFRNPGGGFGLGSTWSDVNILGGGVSYDATIKLEGTAVNGYTCSVTGTCPGTVTVSWSGAAPNKQQAIVFGQNLGHTTIPSGPCAGTTLGIQGGVMQIGGTIGTGNGSGHVNGTAGGSACHHYLQLITGGSCATSSVGQIP